MFHGYAGTSGAKFVNFFIADRIAAPPEHAPHFTESLLYLVTPFLLAEHGAGEFIRPADRGVASLPFASSDVVAACFNSLWKLDEETFNLWLRISARTGANLWLLEYFNETAANVRRFASSRGPQRLIFTPLFPRDTHLRAKSRADLFLDTLRYNGHTTSADALSAGVPLVSVAGPMLHVLNLLPCHRFDSFRVSMTCPCGCGVGEGVDDLRVGFLRACWSGLMRRSCLHAMRRTTSTRRSRF